MKNVVVAIASILAAVSLYLLTSASGNTDLFSGWYPYLLAVNGMVTVTLAATVLYQLIRLRREYRNRRFGSRLKYRLFMMFASSALIPGIMVYAVSLQFVMRSIESWFDVRVDSALEGGLALGQNALDYLAGQIKDKATAMSLDLENQENLSVVKINQLREWAGVGRVTVFGLNGQVLASASDGDTAILFPDTPSPQTLRRAWQERGGYSTVSESGTDKRLVISVLVPLGGSQLTNTPRRLLQLTQPVPEAFTQHADAVQKAYNDYRQLTLGRNSLKHVYTLTLTLTLTMALLAAIMVALILTRRLTAPLHILAEGTQAVARGDFSPRRALPARDELGILTHSFNQMTRQLEEARIQTENSRTEVEAARAYLESVLAHLSAGVLAFSSDSKLRAANRGALAILADDLHGFEDIALADWPRHMFLRDAIVKGFETHKGDWQTEVEIPREDSTPMTLLIHGSRLPTGTGEGRVVVFDDITRLIEAQRTAAWAEVARRLAHEIKNPLTPIQLSAERLALKLSPKLDKPGQQMLERATVTIVDQVEALKNLINAFRDYARLPTPVLEPLDIGKLVREILVLYENSPVKITIHLPDDLPYVLGDASQIRQIIHNMMQNALDALAGVDNGEIAISAQTEGAWVCLSCQDNGSGFPPEVLSHAFEPYFTTKAKGTGLGLAMIKKIVTEHGGDVRIANVDCGGARLRIRLRTEMTNGLN
ncbi:MAG: HAMP domain-containing protein [Azoarcus sp.]|jgi:nitrogen fixation/metabolism regulation signal transduction histidine kinase|nr:HAMP domain-containing protein [Azoarcus sp.]